MKEFAGVWCGYEVEAAGSGFKFKTRNGIRGWTSVTVFSDDGNYWRMKDNRGYEYEIIEKIPA
jgi:hypothetical protein